MERNRDLEQRLWNEVASATQKVESLLDGEAPNRESVAIAFADLDEAVEAFNGYWRRVGAVFLGG